MKYVRVLMLTVFSMLVVNSTSAQIDISNQTIIFGYVDWPPNGSTISKHQGISFLGWAVSCYTGQQPPDAVVWFQSYDQSQPAVKLTDGHGLRYVRQTLPERPDVTTFMRNYCPLHPDKHRWGWRLEVDPLITVPLGSVLFAVRFFDPTVAVAVLDVQQLTLTIVP